MSDNVERSESGSPIHRHKARSRDFELATGDVESMKAIAAHIERYVGPTVEAFHENRGRIEP